MPSFSASISTKRDTEGESSSDSPWANAVPAMAPVRSRAARAGMISHFLRIDASSSISVGVPGSERVLQDTTRRISGRIHGIRRVPRSAQRYVVEGAVWRVHSWGSMNAIDLLILVLVVGGGFLGWVNGLVKWLFTFLGFIVGVFVASRLYGTLDWAIPLVDSDGVRQFVIFILIVGAASIGGWMLGRAVKM
ncbi:MAG: CvpA family protein, partial [Chloroflexi bacterium]|nr:CvpA family protein [Chloroflexota bacterium]